LDLCMLHERLPYTNEQITGVVSVIK